MVEPPEEGERPPGEAPRTGAGHEPAVSAAVSAAQPVGGAGLQPVRGLGWIRALCRVARHAPHLTPLIRPVGVEITWRAAPNMRHAVMSNMRRALARGASDREIRQRARGVYRNFYDFVVETARRPVPPEDLAARIDGVDGLEHYTKARGLGRGVIIATAHLGSFEVAVAGLRAVEDRIWVVFKRDEMPVFDRYRSEQRRRLGVVEAPIDDGLHSWIRLREALRSGGTVLMQADRALPGQRSVVLPFLGGHRRLPLGVARLARLSGAAIVPAFAIRTGGGRMRIEVHEPIFAAEDSGHAGEEAALGRLAQVIADVVGRYPEQWLVLHPAWVEDEEVPWTSHA